MIITNTPLEPFERVAIDTVGALYPTSRGNVHILTIQDNLTKYCLTAPIPDLKTTTIAFALASTLFAVHGTPKVLLSDKGMSFQSKLFKL